MQDNTNNFTDKAKNYVKFRPTYPKECINYLVKEFNIKNKVIADIGSGTGKFTELVLDNSKKIYAVEPNKDMRKEAERLFKNKRKFHSINGTAENTTLKDNSIDVIIVAQAFHWFNTKKTKLEFKRILKPDGIIILVWNKKMNNTKFLRLQKKILNKYDFRIRKNHRNIAKKCIPNFRFKRFYNYQELDLKGFLGRLISTSYCPSHKTKKYKLIENKITKLFNKYSKNNLIRINYNTNVYVGKI